MNLQHIKTWAQERYQEETADAAQEVNPVLRGWAMGAAGAFLEAIEKIEKGESDD